MNHAAESPAPAELQTLLQGYAAARRHVGADTAIVVLQLSEWQLGVAAGIAAAAETVIWRPAGARRVAKDHFKTSPPTPLAMEHAIEGVETVLMPLRPQLPIGARLLSADATLRRIAEMSGGLPGQSMTLTIDAMEHTFNRLVAVVEGTPASHMGLPESPGFAAALLVLREFMHHLHFSQLEILGEP